jgi:hypothetical protein
VVRKKGVKDRPYAVVLDMTNEAGDQVLPISHTPPS